MGCSPYVAERRTYLRDAIGSKPHRGTQHVEELNGTSHGNIEKPALILDAQVFLFLGELLARFVREAS